MKVQNFREVKGMAAAPGVLMHVVAGRAEGAPNFVMRLFEIAPGSATPHHSHPWEHEIFVVSGKGTLKSGDRQTPLREGDAAMVLPDELHSFANAGGDTLRIICVVPLVEGRMPGMPAAD
jgi:quercetin dioxygenase-like cupin family protein